MSNFPKRAIFSQLFNHECNHFILVKLYSIHKWHFNFIRLCHIVFSDISCRHMYVAIDFISFIRINFSLHGICCLNLRLRRLFPPRTFPSSPPTGVAGMPPPPPQAKHSNNWSQIIHSLLNFSGAVKESSYQIGLEKGRGAEENDPQFHILSSLSQRTLISYLVPTYI